MCQINMESGRHKNGRQAQWGEEVHWPGAKVKVHDIESKVVPRVVTVRQLGWASSHPHQCPPHLSHGPWGASWEGTTFMSFLSSSPDHRILSGGRGDVILERQQSVAIAERDITKQAACALCWSVGIQI